MFTNTADRHVYSTVVWFQLTAGHFLHQFTTSLNFAWVFAEVKHGGDLAARQLVLLAIMADQRTAVDVQFPTIELVAFNATTFFADSTQIHGTVQQVACTNRQFTRVER